MSAPHQIQGVFHPTYLPLHQEAARLLDQPHAVIFKGGGGEGQRNPDKPCRAVTVDQGEAGEQVWPALTEQPYPWRNEPLEPARLAALWRGEWSEPGPVAAVIGTTAMALMLLRRAASQSEAQDMASAFGSTARKLGPDQAASGDRALRTCSSSRSVTRGSLPTGPA